MLEVAMVFDLGGAVIHWHEPPGRSRTFIPDSRDLWDILWAHRSRLGGVAHTHPWSGEALPSGIDLSTFEAVDRGIGRHLYWHIETLTNGNTFRRTMGGYTVSAPLFDGTERWKSNIQELRRRSRGE